ncbi:hypothetical protein [Fulvivirga lutimaris]|uniref:hypothetical protein n=1 Tax=Fulvivirga lutimaris TaxID=1819566 RepID=UPI0012BB81C3|nr:hypothetical protein [Fulvivirga lutimaris]MTI39204.1 hypothetical protein [Fulvivirga lutimaris]
MKKNLYLIAGILTGLIFISSLLDSQPGSLFGSVWLFRLGWLIMAISSIMSYFKIRKGEKQLS